MEKAIKAASEATRYAHELGLMVTFFPSDASRSDMDFLSTLLNGVLDAGGHFDSVALVDTFGAFSPEGAAYMVKELLRRVGKPVEAHFHEDFGLRFRRRSLLCRQAHSARMSPSTASANVPEAARWNRWL